MTRVWFLVLLGLAGPPAAMAQTPFHTEAGVLALFLTPRDGGGDQIGVGLFGTRRLSRHWQFEIQATAIPTGGLLDFKGLAVELGTAWRAEGDDFSFEGTAGLAGLRGSDRIGTLTRLGVFAGTTVTWWVGRRLGIQSNARQRFWSGGVGGGSAGIGVAVRW